MVRNSKRRYMNPDSLLSNILVCGREMVVTKDMVKLDRVALSFLGKVCGMGL